MHIAYVMAVRASLWAARQHASGESRTAQERKEGNMFRKTLGITAAAVIALGMLTVGPVSAAQASAPCAVPGEGPRDGSGQGQGLRDGKGNGPRNGQGYGPRRGQAQGLRNGSGQGRGMKQGRGRMLRDGSCVDRGLQPGGGKTINQ
jgi:hypothetical protein